MPQYDFRCNACSRRFSRGFKTYAQAEASVMRCPACDSAEITRLITRVAISKSGRDYRNMSSKEMLSVLESGEAGSVNEMFRQVGGGDKAEGGAPADQSAGG